MRETLVVISGPIGAGKSTLAQGLERRHGALRFSSGQLLRHQLGGDGGRLELQAAGEALDRETGGRWVAESLMDVLKARAQPPPLVVVDSIRIPLQLEALRQRLGSRMVHVHLTAPAEALEARFGQRSSRTDEGVSFEQARANRTESAVHRLADTADLVIDTWRTPPDAVLVLVASHLGLFGRGMEPLVDVLVGGQYGSEGKGHIASYLAREYDFLLRVGGPNAGHCVYEEPEPYTFHLLPSGTRASPDSKVILGPGTVLSLKTLLRELSECRMDEARLFIDPQSVLIEPEDIEWETRTLRSHIGSTAQGVGAATARKVLRTAAEPRVRLAKDVEELRRYLRPTHEILDDAFAQGQRVLLEGTQGTGLSLHHGHYPHVTSRDTTTSGCLAEAGIAPARVRKTLMVCRAYPIRVQNPEEGTSGPMVNELSWEEISRRSGLGVEELKSNECTSTTHRQRRVSEFDWVLLRKAASLNAPTDVALTFVDYLSAKNRDARRFDQLTGEALRLIEGIERVTGAPVSLVSTRFHSRSILDRRVW
ncbi:adenylosuccinate synthetase [Archangium lipolyticum]|uniref:adenylosuccinate synthetase n=1 Tax=Archangium lipolyticum TaxID=2970465 RepID=UPI002149DD69|nr:adenylosuccinate synthetase [Archangium lipolyticum]